MSCFFVISQIFRKEAVAPPPKKKKTYIYINTCTDKYVIDSSCKLMKTDTHIRGMYPLTTLYMYIVKY